MPTSEHTISAHRRAGSRTAIRSIAAGLSVVVGALYLILMFLVADAEAVPGATDSNTFGAYLYLAVVYLLGAGLAAVDRRVAWVVAAAVQVLVIALFVLFGVGVFGPGVFEYEALSDLRMPVWAAVITGSQVILFGLLCYLAATQPRPARPRVPLDGAEPGEPRRGQWPAGR